MLGNEDRSMQALTELVPIYTPRSLPAVEIIFVHGLNGDPLGTWGFSEKIMGTMDRHAIS